MIAAMRPAWHLRRGATRTRRGVHAQGGGMDVASAGRRAPANRRWRATDRAAPCRPRRARTTRPGQRLDGRRTPGAAPRPRRSSRRRCSGPMAAINRAGLDAPLTGERVATVDTPATLAAIPRHPACTATTAPVSRVRQQDRHAIGHHHRHRRTRRRPWRLRSASGIGRWSSPAPDHARLAAPWTWSHASHARHDRSRPTRGAAAHARRRPGSLAGDCQLPRGETRGAPPRRSASADAAAGPTARRSMKVRRAGRRRRHRPFLMRRCHHAQQPPLAGATARGSAGSASIIAGIPAELLTAGVVARPVNCRDQPLRTSTLRAAGAHMLVKISPKRQGGQPSRASWPTPSCISTDGTAWRARKLRGFAVVGQAAVAPAWRRDVPGRGGTRSTMNGAATRCSGR